MPKEIPYSKFVSQVAKDPNETAETSVLRGYLGKASDESKVRIYQTINLSNYIDVASDSILHFELDPKSKLEAYFVWIKADATLTPPTAKDGELTGKMLEGGISKNYASYAKGQRNSIYPISWLATLTCVGTTPGGAVFDGAEHCNATTPNGSLIADAVPCKATTPNGYQAVPAVHCNATTPNGYQFVPAVHCNATTPNGSLVADAVRCNATTPNGSYQAVPAVHCNATTPNGVRYF